MFSILLPKLISLTSKVGKTIMTLHNENIGFIVKSDNTPLTQADKISHSLITEALKEITPNAPILSEESKKIPFSIRKNWDGYWLIDPLDGTRDFLDGTQEFCISIAYIVNNYPVFGLIYAPFDKIHYYRLPGQNSIKLVDNIVTNFTLKSLDAGKILSLVDIQQKIKNSKSTFDQRLILKFSA